MTNAGAAPTTVSVSEQYTGTTSQQVVAPGGSFRSNWSLQASNRWYDLVITASTDAGFIRQLAGHVETGAHGWTDPLL